MYSSATTNYCFDKYHDYAFVTPNAGHTVDPIIYAQEVGLNYPINQKVHDSSQLPGSQIVKSGIGSQVTVGKIGSINSGLVITNLNPVGGDSGVPVYQNDLVTGKVILYGTVWEQLGVDHSTFSPIGGIEFDEGTLQVN